MSTTKTAVVTGAGTGLGEAIAKRLGREGYKVAVWDINLEGVQQTADAINEAGGTAIAQKVDVSKRSEIEAAVEKVHAELGKILVLVNNAAIAAALCPYEEITDEEFQRILNVNLLGLHACTQTILPDMAEAGWGRIINLSSSSAQNGSRQMVHYAASKGGVIGFTKALAAEVGPLGITVNNVPPGFVKTGSLEEMESKGRIPGGIEGIAKTLPVRRVGRPEDIAAAVAYLASEDAGYVTGHTLSVNGGRYMS